MASVTLFSVPKAVTVTHHSEVKACMATWEALSSPKFREAVERGLHECGRRARRLDRQPERQEPGVRPRPT